MPRTRSSASRTLRMSFANYACGLLLPFSELNVADGRLRLQYRTTTIDGALSEDLFRAPLAAFARDLQLGKIAAYPVSRSHLDARPHIHSQVRRKRHYDVTGGRLEARFRERAARPDELYIDRACRRLRPRAAAQLHQPDGPARSVGFYTSERRAQPDRPTGSRKFRHARHVADVDVAAGRFRVQVSAD